MSSTPSRDPRRLAFALLVTACVAAAAGYATWAVLRARTSGRSAGGPVAQGDAAAGSALLGRGGVTVMFRNEVEGEHWARVALVPGDAPHEARTIAPLRCRRLHFAGGRGLCLAEEAGFVATYNAHVFGADFQILHSVSLGGLPSRARVSPDGRYGATTVFVSGHSYSDGTFSTETLLLDLTTGARLGNLETFSVSRDGRRIKAADFNFWGVTFAPDGNRFYATLRTRGETYLVEGDIAARHMRVLHQNVECPSLSPDATRIAYKKRVGANLGGPEWRFHVLDLATMAETPLAETRSVDDQIEWLDDSRLIYEIAPDLWTVPADGSGEPRRFMRRALSPAVIRTAVAPPAADTRTLALPPADVSVTMSAAPDPVRVGQDLVYVVTVENRGPAEARDLGIDVRLASAVTFGGLGRANPPHTPHGCSVQGGYVSCTLVRLASRERWSVEFKVVPNAAGPLRNRVTVDGAQPDPMPRNDSATVVTTVLAPAGAAPSTR